MICDPDGIMACFRLLALFFGEGRKIGKGWDRGLQGKCLEARPFSSFRPFCPFCGMAHVNQKSPLVLQDITIVTFDNSLCPSRAAHSLLLPRSSVIRSRTAPSVNTHCVRTQCDLGIEQSKFTTELMAGEWEWGVSTGFSFLNENVPKG